MPGTAGWVAVLLLTAAACHAALPEWVTLTSASKQFIVEGYKHPQPSGAGGEGTTLIVIDPATFVVTGDRVKQALERELGLSGSWKSRVYVQIHAAQKDREDIYVTAAQSPAGWSYHMDLPDEVEGSRLLRALCEVLLTEYATRSAPGRPAELPPWLAPGLAAQLETSGLSGLILERGQTVVRDRGALNTLQSIRSRLRGRPGLSADRLSWPEAEDLEGDPGEAWQAGAHLFVRELLRLPHGRERLRGTLERLPEHLNWQLAFLAAFEGQFARWVEVEKWWSMVLVHFTGTVAGQPLPLPEAWRRLTQALLTPVQVRLDKSDLPHASYETLQGVVRDLAPAVQQRLLRQKTAQLRDLLPQTPAALAPLVGEYCRTLETHLQDFDSTVQQAGRRSRTPLSLRLITSSTLSRLEELDARRARLGLTLALSAPDPAP